MGMELEFKLAVDDAALLERILSDPQVTQLRTEPFRTYEMATVYYDTPERALKARKWTLRLRQENRLPVATLKTPAVDRARGEWSCEADSIVAAIPQLLAQGAPAELAALTEGTALTPVCEARFTRRAADLRMDDGTVCELAGDLGLLMGGSKKQALCEVELELKSGCADTVEAFAGELLRRFGLREESRSKFRRAAALEEETK